MKKLVLFLCLALAACTGDVGPTGPTGPSGPQGDPGPGTLVMFTGQLSSTGSGGVTLPEAVGAFDSPPSVVCSIADIWDSEIWLILATSNLAGTCALGWQASSQSWAVLLLSVPDWYFRIVVVY